MHTQGRDVALSKLVCGFGPLQEMCALSKEGYGIRQSTSKDSSWQSYPAKVRHERER